MSTVIIKRCESYEQKEVIRAINEGIEAIGGWDQYVKSGQKVLLKVNLLGPKPPESAAVTHCEFVRAMIVILKGKGCEVWIGDSSGGAIAGIAPTRKSFEVSGLNEVAKTEGAVIKSFDREGVVAIEPESGKQEKMYLAKPLFDADVVINLPKFKTHSGVVYTGAVKNVYGCIPGLRKAEYHRLAPDTRDFSEFICDIHKGANFTLHIMDGVEAMDGEGPTSGTVYPAHMILISEDPLALDAVATRMIGIEPSEVPMLQKAYERALGEMEEAMITLLGDFESLPVLENFNLPKAFTHGKEKNSEAVVRVVDFFKTRPVINMKKCVGCNTCVDSCPVGAIDRETKEIDYEKCIECLCCHELCMYNAVELKKDNALADFIGKVMSKHY